MWGGDENDDELARALEESRRFYEEVEIPRLSQQLSNDINYEAGPSTSRTTSTSVYEDRSSIPQFHSGPSTSKAFGSIDTFNNVPNEKNFRNQVQRINNEELYDGPEAEGFCLSEGKHWVYPTNDKFPIRPYQKSIVEKALFNNTLVSLPTGLGKTFIAAVVMYNYYKWYPKGKVIFMAPTKPLVAQQIDNCCNIVGIPRSHTAEMTGAMHAKERAAIWQEKRVFFLTPQIVQNDLSAGICPANAVRCVVIDEAHRAVGDYAYTMVIKSLNSFEVRFRVLALSATPGSDLQAVQKVISNLMINHIELRNEQSPDLIQYTHQRNVETMVVQVGPIIQRIQEKYHEIIQTYATRLQQRKVVFGNVKAMTRFMVQKQWEEFRREGARNMDPNAEKIINADFAVVCSLAHGSELIQTYGLRLLLKHLQGIMEGKGNETACRRLSVDGQITSLMEEINVILNTDVLDEERRETEVRQKKKIIYGHPKLDRLQQVVVSHFEEYEKKEESTRAIVFCEYRDGVIEICDMLKNFQPLVKPVSFMGQASGKTSKGISQKQQLEIMEKFRKGVYNTLVSTSVGEEGLDIGEVDLIICFDAKNSPIRQVQRMGRTGRKRQGRIIMLVTQGKEERKYRTSLWKKNDVNTALLSEELLSGFLSDDSPRMLPPGVEPVCVERTVEVSERPSGQQDLRKMLLKRSAAASLGGKSNSVGVKNALRSALLSEEELETLKQSWNVENCCRFNQLPEREEMWTKLGDDMTKNRTSKSLDLSNYLEFLRFEQRTHVIGNSSDSRMLCYLLNWAEDRLDREEGSQCAVFAQGASSTQLWSKPARKRNRAVADLNDPSEERPTKIRKRGRPKKTNSDKIDSKEEPLIPIQPPENLSDDFITVKRPQFIEDEDESAAAVSCAPPVSHEAPSLPEFVLPENLTGNHALSLTSLDSDGDDVELISPSQVPSGSLLPQKNLMSALLKALNRELPMETEDCDICDNLFPCQSINSLINYEPVKKVSWNKVRLSLENVSKLLPAMTKDNLKKYSAQMAEIPSPRSATFSPVLGNDDFIEQDFDMDFDGAIMCGGFGDYSPPSKSEHNKTKPVCNMIQSGSNLHNSTDDDIQDDVLKRGENGTLISKTGKCDEISKIDRTLNTCTNEEGERHQNSINNLKSNKTFYQHFLDDSFDFLGLSNLEEKLDSEKSPKLPVTTMDDESTLKPDIINKSSSPNDNTMFSKNCRSPVSGNITDSSQVSPILGSQMKKRTRPKIRKLTGICEQNDSIMKPYPHSTLNVCANAKIETPQSPSAPCEEVTTSSQVSPLCDFNICDDSLFNSSPEVDHCLVRSNNIDESIKEAIRNKALEIVSKPPRSLTQQFRDACDSSLDGFSQVLDLVDNKTSQASPNYKIARADSSTFVENEDLIKAFDEAEVRCRAGSPDLFGDEDNAHCDSSVAIISKDSEDKIKCDLPENSLCDAATSTEKNACTKRSVVNEDFKEEELLDSVKRSPSPVLAEFVVKKPSKLSLKSRKGNVTKLTIEDSSKCSIVPPGPNKSLQVEVHELATELKVDNSVSQFDESLFREEFNNSWSCLPGQNISNKFKKINQNVVDSGCKVSGMQSTKEVGDLKTSPKQEEIQKRVNELLYNQQSSEKNDFDLALEKLDAKKIQKNRKLSLSRGTMCSAPKQMHAPPQFVKICDVNENNDAIKVTKESDVCQKSQKVPNVDLVTLSSDDDSPIKMPLKRKNVNLNITSSSEENCSFYQDKKSMKGASVPPKKHIDNNPPSSNCNIKETGWLCAKKSSEKRSQNDESSRLSNTTENGNNTFLDLTSFCDESLLSPFKDDEDFQRHDKGNKTMRHQEVIKENRKKRKKKGIGPRRKCAFVESEAEESDDGHHNSSDESFSSDDLDSSFINDSQVDGTQAPVDMYAKYLQSVRSPARPGCFKIPRRTSPINMNIYSQYPDASELNQSYMNDSFCVDDEPTQYENTEMSVLEAAEARLKAQRKAKRKQRRKNKQSNKVVLTEELSDDEESNKEEENSHSNTAVITEVLSDDEESNKEEQVIEKKRSQKRRTMMLHDSDSDDGGVERLPMADLNTCFKDPKNKSKDDPKCSSVNHMTPASTKDPAQKENEFAKLLEDDNDLFLADEHLFSSGLSSSTKVCSIPTSSPIRPSLFSMKTRVKLNKIGKNAAEDVRPSYPSLLAPEATKAAVFKPPLSLSHPARCSNAVSKAENANFNKVSPGSTFKAQGTSTSTSLVMIVSSRQVASHPELIRILRVSFSVQIIPRSISNADFILSWRLGVSRTFFSDLKDRKRLEVLAKTLRDFFCKPYLIIERDRVKSLGGPSLPKKRKSNESPVPKSVWTPNICNTVALLKQAGINLLFAQDKDETARFIARLIDVETKKGHGIPYLPLNLSDDVEQRLQFFSSLPGINFALAVNLMAKFSSLSQFFASCSSVLDIGSATGLDIAAARKIHKLLCEVHVNA